ncbi:PilZ domain-containing protein [Campylobacter sp. MG1]|uniref:PilZ domain-containing protein n=1 Tax=Campylobacter sp. MG1 TaxID=2976332 RepID=UPI00226CAAF3|nr:PilZ domain-containing protein [Campylobacter sp. MG1]
MSFNGRDELIDSSIDYFEKYTHKFINNIQSYYKNEGKALTRETLESYQELYSMLLIKKFDIEVGKKISNSKDFDKACFFEFLLITYIDFSKYVENNNLDTTLLIYLANALNRYIAIFFKFPLNEQQNNQTNVFSNSNYGFFIQESFIDTFKKMKSIGEKLEFLNLYNGVPVRTFGEILQVDNNSIVVKLDLMQILAMKEEENAYIVQNQYLKKNIKANILWCNIANCTVCLNDFENQMHMYALKRMYPRVHPNEFTKITLTHDDGRSISGKLFDISEGGIGVVSTEDIGFKKGDILKSHIKLHIPNSNENVELDLNFKLVVLIVYQNAYRYCLEILPNQKDSIKIKEFAVKRVEETLIELKNQLELYKRD